MHKVFLFLITFSNIQSFLPVSSDAFLNEESHPEFQKNLYYCPPLNSIPWGCFTLEWIA